VDIDDLRPVRPFGTPWTVGRVVADTCVWIAWQEPDNPEQASIERLLQLRKEARVDIAKTDTVDTERIDGVPDATATVRILETAGIIELHGPAVIGHSRWDHSVYASDEDDTRIGLILATLFPDSDRHATDRTSMHNLRDAMHIATAVRYGYPVFVTTENRLVKKADAMRTGWGIEVMLPSQSVRWVEQLIEKERIMSERRLP
jgi:hypothetical protein